MLSCVQGPPTAALETTQSSQAGKLGQKAAAALRNILMKTQCSAAENTTCRMNQGQTDILGQYLQQRFIYSAHSLVFPQLIRLKLLPQLKR